MDLLITFGYGVAVLLGAVAFLYLTLCVWTCFAPSYSERPTLENWIGFATMFTVAALLIGWVVRA